MVAWMGCGRLEYGFFLVLVVLIGVELITKTYSTRFLAACWGGQGKRGCRTAICEERYWINTWVGLTLGSQRW